MEGSMNDPSVILAQARKQLDALRQCGLPRETLLALLTEDSSYGNVKEDILMKESCSKNHSRMRTSVSSTGSASSDSSRDSAISVSAQPSRPITPTSSSTPSDKPYSCTSCDVSFKRKFDWKRHEEEFHERYRKYPCPDCNQSFWGPNAFNNHHKSAHRCTTCPHASAVVKHLRKRRAWGCGFCGGGSLHGNLDRHFDHVARHFESGLTKADWLHSNVIYGLLHQPQIWEAWNDLLAREHGSEPGRRPLTSWNPAKTGRAPGFMEGECIGQLQDMLEFFDGSEGTAFNIAQIAYQKADVVLQDSHHHHHHHHAGHSKQQHHHHQQVQMTKNRPDQPMPHLHPSEVQRHVSVGHGQGGARRRVVSEPNPTTTRSSSQAHHADKVRHTHTISPRAAAFNGTALPTIPSVYEPSLQIDIEPTRQPSRRKLSLDKELPPTPLAPSSPMDFTFPSTFVTPNHLATTSGDGLTEDWASYASTLLDDQQMSNDFPLTWEALHNFNGH